MIKLNESMIEKSKYYPSMYYVNVHELSYEDEYQRILMPSHVTKLVNTFDINAFQPITINCREWDGNKLIVVDGQHRVEAVKQIGNIDISWVPAQIVHLSKEKEVELFYKINITKKNLDAVDRFYPEVLQGHPDSVFIYNMLSRVGVFSVAKRNMNFDNLESIDCVSAMKTIYRKCVLSPNPINGVVLEKTIQLIADNWQNTTANTSNWMVMGLASFINMYDGSIFLDEKRLIKTMKNNKPKDIHKIASTLPRTNFSSSGNESKLDVKGGLNLTITQALIQKYNEAGNSNLISGGAEIWPIQPNKDVAILKKQYLKIKDTE